MADGGQNPFSFQKFVAQNDEDDDDDFSDDDHEDEKTPRRIRPQLIIEEGENSFDGNVECESSLSDIRGLVPSLSITYL
jgi:hypothetical protein